MASSFDPLPGLAARDRVADRATGAMPAPAADAALETDLPTAARPWFAALGDRQGFLPDPRYARTPSAPPGDIRQQQADAVLADAIADAEQRGREAALEEIANEGAARAALKLTFQRIDQKLHEELAARLAETVAALCEGALAPMALDKEALQNRCIAAATLLGDGFTEASLRLHPDDVALLDADFAASWCIVTNPGQERGTVVFDAPEGVVSDGPAEWRIALREALGL